MSYKSGLLYAIGGPKRTHAFSVHLKYRIGPVPISICGTVNDVHVFEAGPYWTANEARSKPDCGLCRNILEGTARWIAAGGER
jgi:hypothetical protein